MLDKKSDLAGPGISTYEKVDEILPRDYASLLGRKQTQKAIYDVKEYIEKGLARELNLMMVQVPLIVEVASGMNDMLDRDGSRTPVEFHCGLGIDKPVHASIVQAATKWKRWALKQFECDVGEGINTDMRAVRKDYFLDHDHSSYVDQWDWEQVITAGDRNLEYLTQVVRKIWKVITGAEKMVMEKYPELQDPRFPPLPEELHFIHAEEILARYPDLPRKERETRIIEEYGAVFIYGIGWVLDDGYPH
jgi:aspartate--ammonia ligase